MKNYDSVKLSVCMISYNQEEYIEQSLMSAVNQETDFDFENARLS